MEPRGILPSPGAELSLALLPLDSARSAAVTGYLVARFAFPNLGIEFYLRSGVGLVPSEPIMPALANISRLEIIAASGR